MAEQSYRPVKTAGHSRANADRVRQLLNEHVKSRHDDLNDKALSQLTSYLIELESWNRVHNLTAVRDVEDMVERHALESLAIRPLIRGTALMDAGSGAGLPGIPIAIAEPTRQVTLVESQSKKAAFLAHSIAQLRLDNVRVEGQRLESYRVPAGFDTVMARAVARLDRLVALVSHLVKPGGIIVALKGPRWEEEVAELPDGYEIRAVPLEVPGRQSMGIVIERNE